MKLNKDKFYTIIDGEFEKLRVFPESGYTVWESYDPQSNRDWWCAIPTNRILTDIEPFIVSVDDDGNAELGLDDMGDSLTSSLSWNLEHHEYDDVAIIHDERDDDHDYAYYVEDGEVDEDVNGQRKPGPHIHIQGDDDFVTSEEIRAYYLGWEENRGTLYFKDGFSQPPVSIDDLIIEAD